MTIIILGVSGDLYRDSDLIHFHSPHCILGYTFLRGYKRKHDYMSTHVLLFYRHKGSLDIF